MMLSPGYSYEKAPDQQHFLGRAKTPPVQHDPQQPQKLLALQSKPAVPRIPHGPADLRMHALGNADLQHLRMAEAVLSLQDGYAETFAELLAETKWANYGTRSGNPKCANCMVHSGYEASAVDETFGSVRGFLSAARATLFGGRYADARALHDLNQSPPAGPLVQLNVKSHPHAVAEALPSLEA
jgi:hypothetical protein